MKQYILLLRGKSEIDYSPDQLQSRLEEYREWIDTIQDHYVSDNRLEREGAHVIKKGEVRTDGPFLESKEIIAGFVIIQAESLQQASQITETSPLLKYFEIFVRPIVMNEVS